MLRPKICPDMDLSWCFYSNYIYIYIAYLRITYSCLVKKRVNIINRLFVRTFSKCVIVSYMRSMLTVDKMPVDLIAIFASWASVYFMSLLDTFKS